MSHITVEEKTFKISKVCTCVSSQDRAKTETGSLCGEPADPQLLPHHSGPLQLHAAPKVQGSRFTPHRVWTDPPSRWPSPWATLFSCSSRTTCCLSLGRQHPSSVSDTENNLYYYVLCIMMCIFLLLKKDPQEVWAMITFRDTTYEKQYIVLWLCRGIKYASSMT